MGYPVDLFLREDIEQEFICSICHDVLQNVTMVLNCEHVFCRRCITEWNKNANTCPVDRKKIRNYRKAPRIFLNLLNNLQKRCQFHDKGCDAVLSLGDNDQHEEKCNFNPNRNTASKRSSDESSQGGSSGSAPKRPRRRRYSDSDSYDSDQSTQDTSAIDEPYSPAFLSPPSPGGSSISIDLRSRSPSPALSGISSISRSSFSTTSYHFESASEGEGAANEDGNVSDYVSEHEDSVYASDSEADRRSVASFGSLSSGHHSPSRSLSASPDVISGSEQEKSDDDSDDEVEVVGYEDAASTSEASEDEDEEERRSVASASSSEAEEEGRANVWSSTFSSSSSSSSSSSENSDSDSSVVIRRFAAGNGRIRLTLTSEISGVIGADSDSDISEEEEASDSDSD